MERIFGKNFVYAVDCYEMWKNQKCINQSDVNGLIIGIVYDNQMYFAYSGLGEAGFRRPFKIDLSSDNSQILNVDKQSLINEDRIQYFNDEFSGIEDPYICHLFCKYGRISYIRFATPMKDSSLFCPMADTIYEYYGDMIELGSFSNDSIYKLDLICKDIIKSSHTDGLKISLESSVNHKMVWSKMVTSFYSELKSLYERKEQFQLNWESILALYTKDLIEKYYQAIGYVSYFTFNHICEDTYEAATSIAPLNNVNDCAQLKFKVLFDLMVQV